MLTRGKFGNILVSDTPRSRRLYINGELQGGAYFHPGAGTVDPALSGPGPISEAKYALGWLVAGFTHPQASMVMIGLGAGTGAVQLLANFPEVDLTVVEIDPQIAVAAFKSFPLLEYYSNCGRLQIVIQDAAEFFASHCWRWEVGLADAYTGESYDLELSYFPALCAATDSLYVNAIDTFAGERFISIAELMSEYGHTPSTFLQPNQMSDAPGINETAVSNWLMIDDDINISQLECWQPFSMYTQGEAEECQKAWAQMLGACISLPP